ncbi:transglutaminase domain-containing protein [Enterorhabdus sp. P55]|nr:transglutaminase domain-containing protein [Enterorhabdus sp. P55]
MPMSSFDASAAITSAGGSIDVSSASKGYVGASAVNDSRLKFQVVRGERSYNYDLPGDGTPIICPINMGDGAYTFRIMQNTSGSSYVEVASATADVKLESEFAPYLVPNVFCNYTPSSAAVTQARSLVAGAQNEGEVVRAIYDWVVDTIAYDKAKAAELADATGYVPNPDSTLSSREGICFDYASLAAAMFRSLGIPCQIVTGYVSPDNIYHAWNMIYIDGRWVSAQITVNPDTWTRVDLTFAAAGAGGTIGDGTTYTDRYVY